MKQIMDADRCGRLKEGDLLLQINQTQLANMKHAQVVTVLKNCPTGQSAVIVIKRGQSKLLASSNKQNSANNDVTDLSTG